MYKRQNLGREVLHHLDTGEELFQLLELKTNLSAISILDAGSRSAESGKMEIAERLVFSSKSWNNSSPVSKW